MGHFARLDENNIVTDIIVVDNELLLDEDGNEDESLGVEFCQTHFDSDDTFVQTSYNENIRGKYAGLGDEYRSDIDKFVPPNPHTNWIWDETINDWKPPTDPPDDSGTWEWDDDFQVWTQEPPAHAGHPNE